MTSPDPDRPLGAALPDWQAPPRPGPSQIGGRYLRLERLEPSRHAAAIFAATTCDASSWDYMSNGPYTSADELQRWMEQAVRSDAAFYAFTDPASGTAFGYASFMRIDAANGVLEIGNVMISPAAQRSRAASEALMLMIGWAFDAGYRRVEWKCNALNAPSRRAARRYGFAFEGVFRSHMIVKTRNRDTAWYAMTDADWPALAAAYAAWLDPGNFDTEGRQKVRLSDLTAPQCLRAEAEVAAIRAGDA